MSFNMPAASPLFFQILTVLTCTVKFCVGRTQHVLILRAANLHQATRSSKQHSRAPSLLGEGTSWHATLRDSSADALIWQGLIIFLMMVALLCDCPETFFLTCSVLPRCLYTLSAHLPVSYPSMHDAKSRVQSFTLTGPYCLTRH